MNGNKKRWLKYCSLALSCVACALLAFIFFTTQWNVETLGFEGLPQNVKTYWVMDNLSADNEQYFFSDEYPMGNVISYIDEMENDQSFDYCIYGEQYIYKQNEDEEPLLSYEINETASRLFTPVIADGEYFSSEDYQYDASKPIPVVVGYKLATDYPVGTTFTATFMYTEVQFYVKGVLEEGTSLPFHDERAVEDEHILIPAIHFEEADITEENCFLAKALYLQYLTGFMMTSNEESFESVLARIDSCYSSLNLSLPKFARIDSFVLLMLRMKRNTLLIVLLSAVAVALRLFFVMADGKTEHHTFKKMMKCCVVVFADCFIWWCIKNWQITPSFASVNAWIFFIIDGILSIGMTLFSSQLRRPS